MAGDLVARTVQGDPPAGNGRTAIAVGGTLRGPTKFKA